jgi:amino acid transporter
MDAKPQYNLRETSSNEKYVESDDSPAMEGVGTTRTSAGLSRTLQARHIQMIAIGSNIGTGLFIGSGKALHTGGPTSLVTAFVLIAICLTIMMQCLGEMAVVLPVSGSFTRYATRLYDPALGFAMGWQYWLAWVAVFGAEAAAFRVSCTPVRQAEGGKRRVADPFVTAPHQLLE